MSGSCKEFSLSATIKNMSRFVEFEEHYTDTEERFNIPWRMFIEKGVLEISDVGLICDKNNWENRKWSIETDYTMKLVSHNGKSWTKSDKFTFKNSHKRGSCILNSWDELKSDYVVDDSIVIEAYVKIFKMTDVPCDEDENAKTFLLSNTVKNISSIKEGDNYYTEIATRHNIPWRMHIKRYDGFFGFFLRCEKEDCEDLAKSWYIELDYELRLVSLNGQSFTLSDSEFFDYPLEEGFQRFMRWDDMEEKYMVNDSIIIEARVKITKMTGCDDETSIDDLDDEFSDCVINVGGKNYSVKRQ